MHQFKFTQQQAVHLSPEEVEYYTRLGLIRGLGPHMQEVFVRTADEAETLRLELVEAQAEVTRLTEAMPDECPECGAKIPC